MSRGEARPLLASVVGAALVIFLVFQSLDVIVSLAGDAGGAKLPLRTAIRPGTGFDSALPHGIMPSRPRLGPGSRLPLPWTGDTDGAIAPGDPSLATILGVQNSGFTFQDVPAPERRLDSALPGVPPSDRLGNAYAQDDGQVAVLELEEFRLVSYHSPDGGVTFTAEVTVRLDGGPVTATLTATLDYSARLSNDGILYVAGIVADPAGDLGLGITRSYDMGITWPTSTALVENGDEAHGVRDVVLATGPPGMVAILFRGGGGFDPFVTTSTDHGETWTEPVRVDVGVPPRLAAVEWMDVVIDPAGRIHAFYTQDRGGYGASLWRTRSTNGGVTFEPEQSFDIQMPFHERSERTRAVVTAAGTVLVAAWDSGGPLAQSDYVYLFESSDGGQSYTLRLDAPYPFNSGRSFPVEVAISPVTATAIVLTANDRGEVRSYRSPDNGLTFDPPVLVGVGSAGSPELDRPYTRLLSTRVGGVWVVGYTIDSNDPYAGYRTDVVVHNSPDDGASWSPPARADTDLPGETRSCLDGIVATGPVSFLALFQDGRPYNDRSFNYYANRSLGDPIAFVTDYQIDQDGIGITVTAQTSFDHVVATDGVSNIYSAFSAVTEGPFPSVFVTRLPDSGYDGLTVTAIGDRAPGSSIEIAPAVAATSDGRVYVAWTRHAPNGLLEVRAQSSADHGATWLPTDHILGSYPAPATLRPSLTHPSIQIVAQPGGLVRVVFTDQYNIFLSSSDDGGVNFTTVDVDQGGDLSDSPRLLYEGNHVLIVYRGTNLAGTSYSTWAVHSIDGGLSFAPREQLRPEGLPGEAYIPALGGSVTHTAYAVWPDSRDLTRFQLFSNTFVTGTAWLGDFEVAGPQFVNHFFPDVLAVPGIATGTASLVSFEDTQGSVYLSRSTNGITFDQFQRLDVAAPDPAAHSELPRLTADASGNVWVTFLDESAGLPEVAVLHARPGMPFSSLARLSRGLPQGTSAILYEPGQGRPTALPGAAFVPWAATGDSSMFDAVLNVHAPSDQDRDGTPILQDCNDGDSLVWRAPDRIETVSVTARVSTGVGVSVAWESQDSAAGPGTQYDIVTGSLQQVRALGGYGAAACLVGNLDDSPYDDLGPDPAIGDVFLYLPRAKNSCGIGSYGDSSVTPDPRDALDQLGPCQ